MKSTRSEFRETTVFDWDADAIAERSHSAFGPSSLAPLHDRRPSTKSATPKLAVLIVLVLLAGGIASVRELAQYLHTGSF